MRRVLLGITLLALSLYVSATSPPPRALTSPGSRTEASLPLPAAINRGTDKSPLAVRVTQMPQKTAGEISREDRDRSLRLASDNRTFWLGVWTVVIAAFTAFIFVLQLFVFGRQAQRLRESIEESKLATRATQTAANAAEKTVETMNETAGRQLRAYVAVKNGCVVGIRDGSKPIAWLTVKNYGQTPAYKFSVSVDIELVVGSDELHPNKEPSSVLGHLAPSAELVLTAPALVMLTQTHLFQLENGAATIFVHGIIRYFDTFGKEHFTRFRTMIGGGFGLPEDGRLVSCSEGNETDDDEHDTTSA
jgi:hypothetical protein